MGEPIAVDTNEAARLLGLKQRSFYNLVMPYVYSGEIESAKVGQKRLIDYKSLMRWWEAQKAYNSAA